MADEKKKILIVDDEENMRKSLRRLLMLENKYEIFEAENGLVAEKMIKEITPDLILLDIRMPEKDGYELLWDLRNNPAMQNMKIISITGDIGDSGESVMDILDVAACFEKPFDVKEMKAKISELLDS